LVLVVDAKRLGEAEVKNQWQKMKLGKDLQIEKRRQTWLPFWHKINKEARCPLARRQSKNKGFLTVGRYTEENQGGQSQADLASALAKKSR